MQIPEYDEIVEPNDQTLARREHLEKLRELIGNVYPNKFDRSTITGGIDTITDILAFEPVAEIVREIKEVVSKLQERERPDPELKEALNAKLREFGNVRISGRLAVPPRVMGKAAFVHLSDGVSRLQVYVRRDDVIGVHNVAAAAADPSGWEIFQLLDHGDFIGVDGYLFITNTGELSVHVEKLQFLSKAMVPMPDKMHGIADPELQRRFRYADLIAASLQNKTDEEIEEEKRTGVKKLTTREVFERRAKLITGMRRFLDDAGFIEVETPMLTPKATGAAATPFETHHNALDIPLYARIAPELYLKRLTVGGFEKVYELNRNFRNEGLSHKHNPEFTMLEFYCAYMDVNGMMDFAESMIKEAVAKANGGSLQVKYGDNVIDFSRFARLTMKEAIAQGWTKILGKFGPDYFNISWLDDPRMNFHLTNYVCIVGINEIRNGLEISQEMKDIAWKQITDMNIDLNRQIGDSDIVNSAQSLVFLFDELAERNLTNPTFIVDYPKSISPLSKASPDDPNIAERFELFINGMEIANGFSELNDPFEQYERFRDQMNEREGGDEEAMIMDEDYIRALAYGMPPAAGIGIGIDRLVMLLTNKHSIRDVILFPHMRPERRDAGKAEE
ncbi:MAG: lysine--tRNA ligase [Pyrinomonadaceae bacterium]